MLHPMKIRDALYKSAYYSLIGLYLSLNGFGAYASEFPRKGSPTLVDAAAVDDLVVVERVEVDVRALDAALWQVHPNQLAADLIGPFQNVPVLRERAYTARDKELSYIQDKRVSL